MSEEIVYLGPGGYKEMSSISAVHCPVTNSALLWEPKCGGGGRDSWGLSQLVQLYTWAQINFEDQL